ncbi:MAG: hypothetical protein GF317_04920 [Candidatus Lokiarchaeota archaeon]|nr:hypothetical protein [Candidatus Lokiarchaeota archaeon]
MPQKEAKKIIQVIEYSVIISSQNIIGGKIQFVAFLENFKGNRRKRLVLTEESIKNNRGDVSYHIIVWGRHSEDEIAGVRMVPFLDQCLFYIWDKKEAFEKFEEVVSVYDGISPHYLAYEKSVENLGEVPVCVHCKHELKFCPNCGGELKFKEVGDDCSCDVKTVTVPGVFSKVDVFATPWDSFNNHVDEDLIEDIEKD